jgi:hypothetical protein
MQRLIGDEAMRAVFAERGLERARHFSWRQTARSVRGAYEDALRARRHRVPAPAGPAGIQSRDADRH